MSTRQAKQIIYGALYAILWVAVIFFFYSTFIKPAPSCYDGVKNQNEEGVDCGGVCPTACGVAAAQALSAAGGVSIFSTSANHYTFLAEVQNHNSDLAAKSFDYTFDLYSPAGTVIVSLPGQSFIYANEVKYIVLPNQTVSQPVDHAALTITNTQFVKSSDVGSIVPAFKFENVTGQVSPSTVSIGGQITNDDIASFPAVTIVGIFKDSSGNVIGASETEVDHFDPNTTQSFSVIYPAVATIDPSESQVFAYGLRP